jgi:histidyl-tRNA synthetase
MKTPVFEHTGVFKKDNDTSDMVTKEMYTFSVNDKDSLTLRPEGTAGIMRSIIEHKMYANEELPLKLGYIEEMFRHERPQKGRQRQFTQMGVECVGEKNPLIDAETIALGYFYLKALGISSIKVLINTLGDESSRLNYKKELNAYFKKYENELCFDCKNRLEKNPLRILDCKVDFSKDFISNAPKMKLSEEASAYFEKVKEYLKVMNIPYEVEDRLVRGLDYYTDTVFEIVSTHEESGSQATVFAGGRYDNLIEEMGGPKLSGIGFAIGVERLLILAEAEGLFIEYEKSIDAYIINLSDDYSYALRVIQMLRNEGLNCEMNYFKRSLKSQFKSSERKNARFVLIIGEDEIKEKKISLKDTLTKAQEEIKVSELVNRTKKLLEDYYV